MFIERKRPAVPGSEIFQKLNAGASGAAQRSDAQAGAEYIVQVLLLGPVVLTLPGYMHAQKITVKLHAGLCIGDHDGSVINAQEQLVRWTMPLLRPFVRRKLEHF